MRSKQLWLLVALMLLSIVMMACTIVYMVVHTENLEASVKKQLSDLNIPSIEDLTPDQAQIILGVARYCESSDNCKGEDGKSIVGPKGDSVIGPEGPIGAKGDTIIGPTGPSPSNEQIASAVSDYCSVDDRCRGPQGTQGNDGRKYIEQCNAEKRQVEWMYEGDENWNFKYKLSPLQSCTGGI